MNKVHLIGFLQDDNLIVKTTGAGDSVLNFTIRVKRNKETSDFIDCTSWKGTADFISKYFKKNDPIIVTGRIATSLYEKNGEKRKKLYVDVTEAEFCPTQRMNTEEVKAKPSFENIDDEDLPFG